MMSTAGPRRMIRTDEVPAAIGPYSQAVRVGGFLFCSGQIGLDPVRGELVPGPVSAQADRCLANLEAVCRSAGARLTDAARITIYLTDLDQLSTVNEVYERHFNDQPPARVTIGVASLPMGAQVEIDAVVPDPPT